MFTVALLYSPWAIGDQAARRKSTELNVVEQMSRIEEAATLQDNSGSGAATTEPASIEPTRPSSVEQGLGHEFVRRAGGDPSDGAGSEMKQRLEVVLTSKVGGIFLVGWVDDRDGEVASIAISHARWSLKVRGNVLGRVRRADVESLVMPSSSWAFGFYAFVFTESVAPEGICSYEIELTSGRKAGGHVKAGSVDGMELRDIILRSVATAAYLGNSHIKAIEALDRGAASEILKFNREITKICVQSPYIERFGRSSPRYEGSIIVCLFGIPSYLSLQSALFGQTVGIRDYEFIFVSNSPELAEILLREARSASLIYALDISVVILAGNAGFSAANNIGAGYARSDRVIIVNPDVFPRDANFAVQHKSIVDTAPKDESRFFGASLYYDDGSLMHGGMYFEVDRGVSLDRGRHRSYRLGRVEHYGKGAPPQSGDFSRVRAVPAVTGAFMSCDRSWYENLGGFTEDYIYGHYEDADLCLKSLYSGCPVWIQDLSLWHLEGKGSVRMPQHEGGSLINRWLFSANWGEALAGPVSGSKPDHPALNASRSFANLPAFESRNES